MLEAVPTDRSFLGRHHEDCHVGQCRKTVDDCGGAGRLSPVVFLVSAAEPRKAYGLTLSRPCDQRVTGRIANHEATSKPFRW